MSSTPTIDELHGFKMGFRPFMGVGAVETEALPYEDFWPLMGFQPHEPCVKLDFGVRLSDIGQIPPLHRYEPPGRTLYIVKGRSCGMSEQFANRAMQQLEDSADRTSRAMREFGKVVITGTHCLPITVARYDVKLASPVLPPPTPRSFPTPGKRKRHASKRRK